MAMEHLEIKKIKGQNYAYTTVNLWDKKNKKEIKISKYLGKVNTNNEIERKVSLPEKSYQYGDVAFLVSMNYDLILKISGTYDKYWREIITSALITIVGQIPLEYVKRYYRKTILYHYWPKLKLEPKNIASMLRYIAYNKLAFENLEDYDESTLIMHIEIITPAYPVDYSIITAIVFIIISAIAIVIYARKHPSQIHKAGMADKQVQDQINKNE